MGTTNTLIKTRLLLSRQDYFLPLSTLDKTGLIAEQELSALRSAENATCGLHGMMGYAHLSVAVPSC